MLVNHHLLCCTVMLFPCGNMWSQHMLIFHLSSGGALWKCHINTQIPVDVTIHHKSLFSLALDIHVGTHLTISLQKCFQENRMNFFTWFLITEMVKVIDIQFQENDRSPYGTWWMSLLLMARHHKQSGHPAWPCTCFLWSALIGQSNQTCLKLETLNHDNLNFR